MDDERVNSWDKVERGKKELFDRVISGLNDEEFELLRLVLELEAANRHLNKPHGMKDQVVAITERVFK